MLSQILISLVIVNSVVNGDIGSQWNAFKRTYGKKYNLSAEASKFGVFKQNVEMIKAHNFEEDMEYHSFRLGINQFADLNRLEYLEMVQGKSFINKPVKRVLKGRKPNVTVPIPESVDWREKGCVTPPRDQGQIGSPSIISSVGALEGLECQMATPLVSLSVHQLADCCGNSPPRSLNPVDYFKCVTRIGGIDSDICYWLSTNCSYNPQCVAVRSKGFVEINSGDEIALRNSVATTGPVSVGIDASQVSFQFYTSGIYDDPLCTDIIDHFVLVVGYGSENGEDFWLVKNSWGESWGEKGYIRMARNKGNLCGIATMASYPILDPQ